MQRINSHSTFFYKSIFPIFWFGFAVLFLCADFFNQNHQNPTLFLPGIIVPVVMVVIGYFIMKNLIWDLADEVLDSGNSLMVRIGQEQEQIPLSNIINVSYSYMMNPPRVTLTLRTPSRFGNEVSFSPPRSFSLVPFAKSPIVADLIQRVDAARRAAM